MNNAFGLFATKNIRLCAIALAAAIAVSMTGCPNDTTRTEGGTFVPVTDITGVPTQATAGTPLTLTGTVVPSGATNRAIVWSVYDAGNTGATIDGNTLNTAATGTATVRATIANGASATADFTRNFDVTVDPAITLVPGNNLASRLEWLRNNAQDDSFYLVEITADEYIAPDQTALPTDRNNLVVVLRGRGEMRTVSLSANGSLFTVGSGVTLILDENVTLVGRDDNDNPLLRISDDGILIMEDGSAVTGNTNTTTVIADRGGGVRVHEGGRFYMRGGRIFGNEIVGAGSGIGVHVIDNGTFTMDGGEISGNEASGGNANGGVLVHNTSTFTMEGGKITENKGGGNTGGGVRVGPGSTFIMRDGKITGNETTGTAGGGGVGVFGTVASPATFVMEGGEISGNETTEFWSGGGVIVNHESRFYMRGGRITGNTANGSGDAGGVRVRAISSDTSTGVSIRGRAFFTMEGGEIFGNQATTGGVLLDGMSTFNMKGGEIFGNEAASFGGGVAITQGHSDAGGTLQISNGIIRGVDAEAGRENTTTRDDGAALLLSLGTAEHGTFNNAGEFAPLGTLDTTNYTIHVVNGELQ